MREFPPSLPTGENRSGIQRATDGTPLLNGIAYYSTDGVLCLSPGADRQQLMRIMEMGRRTQPSPTTNEE